MTKRFALDIGYGFAKGVDPKRRRPTKIRSAVSKVQDSLDDTAKADFADATGRYLVGENALMYGKPETPSVDSSYIESVKYRILGLSLIAQMLGEREKGAQPVDVHIVTGLPVEFFKKDRARLKDIVMSWRHPWFRIAGVDVIPQPMGTLLHSMFDWDGRQIHNFVKQRIALVDVGHGTIDAIEAVNNQITDTYRGASHGVSTMYNELFDVLSKSKNGDHLTRAQMQDVVTEGGFYRGPSFVSAEKEIALTKKHMVNRIMGVVSETWPRTEVLYRIIFTGGGAAMLKSELEAAYEPDQVIVPSDPDIANAIGYAKLANMRTPARDHG